MPRKRAKPKRRKRGSGAVARQPDGSYAAILPSWLDPGRKLHRGFGTPQAASDWLDAAIARTRELPEADITVAAYMTQWRERVADSADWSRATRRTRKNELHALDHLADRPLRSLKPSDIQEIIATMRRRGCGPSLVRSTAGVIRRALADALDDGLVARNVAARLVLPRQTKPEPRAWSRAECRRLLEAAHDAESPIVEPLVTTGLILGMRIGELLGLQWDDLAGQTLRIQRGISLGRVGPTKTRRNRTIGLPVPVWSALLRHHERQHEGAVWVFESEATRKPWSYTYVLRQLRALCVAADVRDLGSHALRHSAATAMLASGVLASDVAATLGHASPAVTLSTYFSPVGEGPTPPEAVVAWLAEGESGAETGDKRRDKRRSDELPGGAEA